MDPFGVVELQGACDGIEDGGRRAGERAAFELGVVLDADPGEGSDLASAQTGDATVANVGQSGLLRCEFGSSGHEELAYLATVVHNEDSTTQLGWASGRCRFVPSGPAVWQSL